MSSKNKKDQNEPTKKAKKGKKGKKKDEHRLLKVEETFYQLTVADCEKKINHMRKHLQFLNESNVAIKEQIRSLNEDKVDAAAEMTRKVDAANEQIYNFMEKIHELSQEYSEVKSKGDATINDLEEKFKAMHNQLTAEVKTLKSHLNMLEEFPKIEEKLNYINELEEERRKEKERQNKELIHATERLIKGERETMRKEIERKLLHVSEQFTRQSTLRNAAYTQRLIRENIALEKEIKILESTSRSTEQQLKEQVARYKEVKATFPALNEKKRGLILIAQQKTSLIEELTTKYENIKAAYVESLLYKTQYVELTKYKQCGHFQRKELIKQAKKLGTNAHTVKAECLYLETDCERNKQEIENLKRIIGLIRETILKAIGVLDYESPRCKKMEKAKKTEITTNEMETAPEENLLVEDYFGSSVDVDDDDEEEVEANGVEEEETFKTRTQGLLETLFQILSYYKHHKMSTSSLATIPYDNLLKQHSELIERSSDSLREVYKHNKTVADLIKKASDHLTPTPFLKQIIPTERPERCQLLDFEKGSTLYVSFSESDPEMVSVEAQPDDQEEVLGSSSSYENISENPPPAEEAAVEAQTIEKKESQSQFSLSEMPAGTILDVEMADEIEEEFERTEREDDVYLTDTNRENTKDINADEEDEQEMPIYMFY